jgi:hypothetical protein
LPLRFAGDIVRRDGGAVEELNPRGRALGVA